MEPRGNGGQRKWRPEEMEAKGNGDQRKCRPKDTNAVTFVRHVTVLLAVSPTFRQRNEVEPRKEAGQRIES